MKEALAWCRKNPRDFAAAWFFIYRLAWAIYWSTATQHASAFLFSLHYGWTPVLCSAAVAGALGYRWGRRIADGSVSRFAGACLVGICLQFLTTILYTPLAVLLTMSSTGENLVAQFLMRVYFSYVFSLAGVPVHLILGAVTGGGLYIMSRMSRKTVSGIASPPVISEDESFYKDVIFLGTIALSLGWPFLVGKLYEHKLIASFAPPNPEKVRVSIPTPPSGVGPPLTEAYAYVRARDWPNALEEAKKEIQARPYWSEPYHTAGLAAGQIYGLYSKKSRDYYAKYVELEPDTAKKAFVKQIFPDLLP